MPFVQYVNRLRIESACQMLLADDANITDICFQAGFNNVSNFNRQFRAVKGMAPSEFRALQRLNARSRGSRCTRRPPAIRCRRVSSRPASPSSRRSQDDRGAAARLNFPHRFTQRNRVAHVARGAFTHEKLHT